MGYPHAKLCVNGQRFQVYVHRLVAESFIPNPNNYPEINHIDSVRDNNNVNNLEWVTHKQNMHHASLKGRMKGGDNMRRLMEQRRKEATKRRKAKTNMDNREREQLADNCTFPELWGFLKQDDRDALSIKLFQTKCCKSRQTVWNWATGKTRPIPLVRKEAAKVIAKFIGKRVAGDTLFPEA